MINADGEVVGVNSQMLSIGGGGEGLGFALPASVVERSAEYLRDSKDVPYAYLGANSKALWRGAGDSGDLPDRPGSLIGEVRQGSPAYDGRPARRHRPDHRAGQRLPRRRRPDHRARRP